MHATLRHTLLWLVVLSPAAVSLAADSPAVPETAWRDTYTSRLEALALLQTLNADLLSHDSATLTLDRWCDAHHLASPARLVAERVRGQDKPPSPELRDALGVSAGEPVRYRRVRLRCGDRVLSEADNWYVPARLTSGMNHALDTSDVPFGRAVQALHFRRRTLSATLLWSPLPEGWEMGAASTPSAAAPAGTDERQPAAQTSGHAVLQVPPQVLQHRAILTLPDGTPFSQVVETYTAEVLGFPEPPLD